MSEEHEGYTVDMNTITDEEVREIAKDRPTEVAEIQFLLKNTIDGIPAYEGMDLAEFAQGAKEFLQTAYDVLQEARDQYPEFPAKQWIHAAGRMHQLQQECLEMFQEQHPDKDPDNDLVYGWINRIYHVLASPLAPKEWDQDRAPQAQLQWHYLREAPSKTEKLFDILEENEQNRKEQER